MKVIFFTYFLNFISNVFSYQFYLKFKGDSVANLSDLPNYFYQYFYELEFFYHIFVEMHQIIFYILWLYQPLLLKDNFLVILVLFN